MIGLLRIQMVIPKLRFCGNNSIISKQCTQIPKIIGNVVRTNMTRTSERLEAKLRSKDLVPNDFNIIYRGGMDGYVHLAHHSSTVLITIGVAIIYQVFYGAEEPITFPIQPSAGFIGIKNYTQLFIMYFAYFVSLSLMRIWSSQYVMRMYYNAQTQTFRAIQVGHLPGITRNFDFKAGTATKKETKRWIPWLEAQIKVGNKKMLLFDHGFKTNAHYERMFSNT